MKHNEVTLEKDTKFTTKYGTMSESAFPSVLYMRSKAKITPARQKPSYEGDIDEVKRQFLEYVGSQVRNSKVFQDSHLCNIDISSKSVAHGKVSFLRYDIYLKPTTRRPFEDNQKAFTDFSARLDLKLGKLLEKHGIDCV